MRFEETLTADVKEHIAHAKTIAETLSKRKEELTETMSAQTLKEHIQLYETYATHMTLAGVNSSAALDCDTENEELNALDNYVSQYGTEIGETLIYFTLTLKNFPEQTLKTFEAEIPEYAKWISEIREGAKHALSEAEERIISRKDANGSDTLDKIYGLITSRYTYEFDGKTLTAEQLWPYRTSQDREVRRKAYEAIIQPYKQDKTILTEIYASLTKDYDDESTLRGYNKPIDIRHQANDITEKTYEALKEATQESLPMWNTYLRKKQHILNIPDFKYYDISAPIPGLSQGKNFEESKQEILEVFEKYADWMKEHAQKLFENNRIDAHPRKNKRGGACCYGLPQGNLPLVILNHTETIDATQTMAHELGHAIHDQLAANKNNTLQYHPQLVLAETASTLAEHIVFKHTYEQTNNKALLAHYIDDIFKTSVWQMRYVAFEEYAHGAIQQGATPTQLTQKWKELSEEWFYALTTEETDTERWYTIPHIFSTPFYCYSYAFGILLALTLYAHATPEQIKTILEAGGSKKPTQLLKELGFDIETKEFWNSGYDYVQTLIEQL